MDDEVGGGSRVEGEGGRMRGCGGGFDALWL